MAGCGQGAAGTQERSSARQNAPSGPQCDQPKLPGTGAWFSIAARWFFAKTAHQQSCDVHVQGYTRNLRLDSQALAAFGAARIDDRTATAGLHANKKAMGAGTTNFGGLVSAFHFGIPNRLSSGPPPFKKLWYPVKSPRTRSGEPPIMANFLRRGKTLHQERTVALYVSVA